MGIELAKAYVRVRGDTQQLPSDLDKAKTITKAALSDSSAQASAAISDMQTQMVGAITAARIAAAGLLGTFASMGKGFISKGLFAAGSFEQTTIAFETMIGSVNETKKTLASLTDFAAKTPFEMPEILQAARGLIQFGERGKEMMETLNILGEAAAGTSQPFGMLALIFNQVRGVGKLLTQDFRQLSTRGVISLQDIADHYGKTTAEAQKMLSSGKVTFNDFKEILKKQTQEGGRFFNLMVRQSQSFLGLISTLKDGWNILSRELAAAVLPVAKKLVDTTIKAVDAGLAFVQANKRAASAAFAGAVAFAGLGASLIGVKVAASALNLTFTQMAIKMGVVVGLVASVVAAGAAVGFLVAKNWEWIRGMIEASGVLTTLRDTAISVWTAISNWAISKFNDIKNWVDSNWQLLSEIWFLIKEVAINAWETIKAAWSGLVEFFGGIAEIVSGYFQDMFEGTPLQSMGATSTFFLQWVRRILDGVSLLSTNWGLTWEWMKTQATISFLIIKEKAMVVWETMTAAANAAGVAIWELMGAMFDNVGAMATNFVNSFIIGVKTIGVAFKALWEGIKAGFTGEDIFGSIQKTFNDEMTKMSSQFQKPEEIRKVNPMATFQDEFAKGIGSDNPLADEIDAAKAKSEELINKMKEERDLKRLIRGDDGLEVLGKGTVRPRTDAKKEGEGVGGEGGAEFLKPGRVGIAALGTKVQDLFLKGDKDKVQKDQLETQKKTLKVAQDQLAESRKGKSLGLVGDVGSSPGAT